MIGSRVFWVIVYNFFILFVSNMILEKGWMWVNVFLEVEGNVGFLGVRDGIMLELVD